MKKVSLGKGRDRKKKGRKKRPINTCSEMAINIARIANAVTLYYQITLIVRSLNFFMDGQTTITL